MVPPLRQRPEDIFMLLEFFLAEHKSRRVRFSAEAREALQCYPWPGNIRELNNVASYLSFMETDPVTLESLPYYLLAEPMERGGEGAPPRHPDRARAVLAVLAGLGRGAGRKGLGVALARAGFEFTEGEVRGLLADLNQAGLVRSRAGRGGSAITEQGRRFLNGQLNGLMG
jgi:DNA-binding NtrC family response regulator